MKSPAKRKMKSPAKRNHLRKEDGNNICQLGIASLIRKNTDMGPLRDFLNDIVHSKDKGGKLEFNNDTDIIFTQNNINASDHCTDGADVCQRGLGAWFRSRSSSLNCYDDLSQYAVHPSNDTYDPEIDTLLEKCSKKSVEELDTMCTVPASLLNEKNRLWKIYMDEKDEELRKQEEELRKQEQKHLKKKIKELKRLGITLEDVRLMYEELSRTRSRTRSIHTRSTGDPSGW